MIPIIDVETFLEKSKIIPVIDVRSESEYKQGHFHQAFNIPILNDEDRAIVGTIYKKEKSYSAFLKGLDLVGPKLSTFVKNSLKIAPKKEVIIYCWRGGKRSNSFAWLLKNAGFKVSVLDKGYKNLRHFIRSYFNQEAKVVILSGTTGSGKTEILEELVKKNEQIVDLEGLANHKGSAFGSLGQLDQPTNEQFENNLFNEWFNLDLSKTIWLEDESRNIGKVSINEFLFVKMRSAIVIRIEIPVEDRIKRLTNDYCTFPKENLLKVIEKISKRLGGKDAKDVSSCIENEDYEGAVKRILDYYDKSYNYGLSKRDPESIHYLKFEVEDQKNIAKTLIDYLNAL